MKITLKPLMLLKLIVSYLLSHTFITISALDKFSISATTKTLFPSYNYILRFFFKKNFRDFQAFIDHILNKFRKDSQYQLEKL